MEIGSKIKLMRLECSLTQEELADRCELTKGFISQLENDLTNVTVDTLDDIVTALGSSLGQFFKDEKAEKIVFTGEDYFHKESDSSTQTWLITNSAKNEMEPILVVLKPGASTDSDRPHEGEEFGYVLEGRLTLHLGDDKHKCSAGDSFYYMPNKMHHITNDSKKPVKFLWISSPPNF